MHWRFVFILSLIIYQEFLVFGVAWYMGFLPMADNARP